MAYIVEAFLNDAVDILALQKTAYQSEAKLYNDWTLPALTQTIESLQEEFKQSRVLKALINGEMVGSVRARVDNGVCHIGRLIVSPDHQRQGIGTALLSNIEAMYTSADEFHLFTGSKSIDNIRLYEKLGYVKSHTKCLSKNVDLVFMVKPSKNRNAKISC